jgi:hypothetical protein
MAHLTWEIVGYTAMVLVTLSLMMRSIVRLRWINLAGAVLFTIYGIAISAYPVAILNLAVVAINLYHLWNMRRPHEALAVVRMPSDSDYVRRFMEFHGREIARLQPNASVPTDGTVLFVLRDTVPAGIIALDPPKEDGTGRVRLAFATRAYRDLKIGRFVFLVDRTLRDLGYRRLRARSENDEDSRYLARVGFTLSGDDHLLELPATDR